MVSVWKGVVIGISIAAPVGPIGLLCIRRALAEGRWAGFVSGLGAATAAAIYGVVAALGLGALTTFLLAHQRWLQIGGGLFLLWLGAQTLRAPAPRAAARSARLERGGLRWVNVTSGAIIAGFGAWQLVATWRTR